MRLLGLALAFMLASGSTVLSDAVEDFYRGKSVSLYIGYSAGGGYDRYARLLARYLGKHIPGKPSIVPQNMPGAGSLKATTFLANVAPRDGTAIGTFARGMPFFPLLFTPDFDATKLGYIGSITTDTSVCVTWHTSQIKRWDDLFSKQAVFGGEGKGSDPDLFATLLKEAFDAKVRLVSGYPGTADMTLAMERGELDGLCGISYSTLKSGHSDWLKDKKINIVVQIATTKDPAIPDVPLILDVSTNPRQKQLLTLAVAPQAMARPFAAPSDVPADRLKALREAFDAAMRDPDFLAEASKGNLDINPMSGKAISDMVLELYKTPADIVKETGRAMGGQ